MSAPGHDSYAAESADDDKNRGGDTAPGDSPAGRDEIFAALRFYLVGLAFAAVLTVLSFGIASTGLIWGPGIPVALIVFAIAQMGVHLVFFLHITTSADNTNNILALAFGTLIVILVIGGSLWIMANLNRNMMPNMPGMSGDNSMQMGR